MLKFPAILGVVIGLCAAVIVISTISGKQNSTITAAPVISECDGALKELVIHYVRGGDAVLPVYQQFLPLLSRVTTVHVVCPEQADFDELRDALPKFACRLDAILTHHEMTAWSRDRWVALPGANEGEPTTLLAPRGENSAASWPARAGDQQVAFDIARALSSRFSALRSELNFDAGDFLSDGGTVFVTSSVLHRNLNQTVASRDELVDILHRELHAKIVLMDDSPDHHAAMFMTVAAGRTMLIADPRIARDLLPSDAAILATLPGGPGFSSETQCRLDAIALRCRSLGCTVVRIPTLPAMDRKTYLTYVNVLSEMRDGKKIVYMPVFRGAEALNDAAERTWRGIGYEVHRIDCTSTYGLFGNLHCLINVLHREGETRGAPLTRGSEARQEPPPPRWVRAS
jgi:hypothetical protein